MAVKTSATHPIRIDWIVRGLPGDIGLTFAPGKHGPSKYEGGSWARDLDADLDAFAGKYAIAVQVCLLEVHELTALKIPCLVEEATRRGIRVVRLPIPDAGVLPDLEPVRSLVPDIIASARAGRNVAIHCAGGLGRAGTIGGCVLVALGHSTDEALRILAETRGPNCPETDGQRAFIRCFAEWISGAASGTR